jgi:hypothetical protein
MMQAGCRRSVRPVLAGVFAGVVAMAAAPATFAATAPPGYVIARSAPLVAGVSMMISGGQERCPTGKVVWGGGTGFLGTPGPGEAISGSAPVGSGAWEAHVDNLLHQAPDFRVDVFCANTPKSYKVISKTVANAAGAETLATVGCPKKTVVLSGGALSTSESALADLTSAFPIGQTKFRGTVFNGTGAAANLQVYAVCAARPAGYKIATRTETALAHDTLLGTLGCPAKTSIVGGGVKLATPEAGMSIPDDLDGASTGWDADVVNQTAVSQAVTLYAICAA